VGELWMFLDCVEVYDGRSEARRDVWRALSEEAAVEARGKAASNCDDRFMLAEGYMEDGRSPGWYHMRWQFN
jgi:hypothetical protein